MKRLPQLQLDYGPLARILCGALPAKALLTAIELKVFAHLTAPTSADAVADRLGTHRKNTRLLLDAMVANELLRKRGGQYWRV